MKKEHIMDAMDHIDPALIAAADAPAPRRGRKGWVRYGLIAACLCLALAGTAVAAQYLGVRIVDGAGTDVDVWLQGGIAYYPLDSLSEEVAAIDDPFRAAKAFDSWDKVEEFIGVDLMNNPVLDASPAERYFHEWCGVSGRFLAVGSGNLSDIRVVGCYEIGQVNISVEGFLFTDRTTEKYEDWDQRFLGYSFRDDVQLNQENYMTPSGLETQIMQINAECRAVFSIKGIPFVVTADSGGSVDENHAVLLQVLDGFEVN